MDVSTKPGDVPAWPGPAPRRGEAPRIAEFGAFRLDCARRLLTAGEHIVALQPRAFDMLELFVACRGQVLSADEIVGHVWRGIAVGDNNLGVQLSALRRALATHGGEGLIVTLPGRGYRFIGEVVEVPGSGPAAGAPPGAAEPTVLGRPRAPVWMRAGLAAAALLVTGCLSVAAWRAFVPAPAAPIAAVKEAFSPPARSVAVLAFANLSSDPAQEYLADGLSEAVIGALSRINQLQVTARTSSFYFKARPATIDEIARRLNVGSVVEGSLRRQGNHLRIDAHLSDARTGYELWSQSYDVEMADMLKLQDQIAAAVAAALQVKLIGTEKFAQGAGGTTNLQAFDAYLKGEQHLREGFEGASPALPFFRKAVSIDANFALAQSGLAADLAFVNAGSDTYDDAYRQRMVEARRIAEHAVALAPGAGLPHARLAYVLSLSAADMDIAWAEAKRAIALTPGDATVVGLFAQIAILEGHDDEAIAAARRAVQLDPLRADSWYALGLTLDGSRHFDLAIEALQRGIALLGHTPFQFSTEIGSLLVEEGKAEAARTYCLAMPAWGGGCLLLANHLLGRQADVDAKVAQMQSHIDYTMSYNYAEMYAQLGQPAVAMRWLADASALRDSALSLMRRDPMLDPIRNQPGFKEIEQTLHYPPLD